MHEIWKDVVGYEGLYRVSSYGKIKSLDRIIKLEKYDRPYQGRIMRLKYLLKVSFFALTIKVSESMYRFRLLCYIHDLWKEEILKVLRIKYV